LNHHKLPSNPCSHSVVLLSLCHVSAARYLASQSSMNENAAIFALCRHDVQETLQWFTWLACNKKHQACTPPSATLIADDLSTPHASIINHQSSSGIQTRPAFAYARVLVDIDQFYDLQDPHHRAALTSILSNTHLLGIACRFRTDDAQRSSDLDTGNHCQGLIITNSASQPSSVKVQQLCCVHCLGRPAH
jgi:hypothetical protein